MKKLLTVGALSLLLMVSSAFADLLTAYKIGAATDVASVKAKLAGAGFDVVGTYKSDAGTTVLYTNAALKAMGDKESRGLASVGRILVNDTQLSIANPVYFGKAFMQKEYNNDVSTATLASLEKAFGPLKDSEDKFEESDLAGYHFMVGMPYYEDMDVVGEGATADLVTKAKASKGVTAVLQLSADRYVAFVDLEKRTNGFVKKIGLQNGELLPWAVLIEGGKAKALNAKYFIAISYPLFTMSEFMTIATVPGATTKDLERIFK
ncbi:MAG: hypothetical protein ACXWVU_00250 [Sulfuricurvum sp.]